MSPPELISTPHGRFWVYPEDLIGRTLKGDGNPANCNLWDAPFLQPFFERFADPQGYVIDVGAYMGYLSVWLSRRYAGVLAIEPLPGTFDMLCKNLDLNHVENVRPIMIAAHERDVRMRLAAEEAQGQDLHALDYSKIGNIGGIALVEDPDGPYQARRLDTVLARIDWAPRRIVAIKVDAQGCDLLALYGLYETIMRWRPGIIFEFEEGLSALHGCAWKDYKGFLDRIGYRLEPSQNASNWIGVPD